MNRLITARRIAQLRGPNAQPILTRHYSSPSTHDTPPLMLKLKSDLKTAMRAKDTPRLTVVRAVLAAHLNASKTPTPVRTDFELVALMRKLQKTSEDAVAEARAAGRADLVEKEMVEVEILGEYIAGSGVESLTGEQLRVLVREAVDAARGEGAAPAKSLMGDVMKRLAGQLEGKDVDMKAVAALVKETTTTTTSG